MRLRGALFAASLTAALALLAPSADAATCDFLPSPGVVVINLAGSSDVVDLKRVGNVFYDGSKQCGTGATVFNTDAIYIRDTTASRNGDDFVGIDLSGGAFAPGKSSEAPYGVPEIEILLFLERGNNFVRVTGSGGADNFQLGMTRSSGNEPSPGINLNAGPESDPSKVADADVTFEPANPLNDPANETLQIDGDFGGDTISAAGGPGFDGPLKPAITLFGGPGNDRLTGGAGSDTLYADAGDDVLDGGNNFDIATFETSPNAVNLDLGNAQPQDTGALGKDQLSHVESLKGSQYDDVLTGNDGANGLFGGAGNDLLTGRGGAGDGIDGGPGTDTASYRLPPAGETRGVTVDLGKDVSQQTTGAGFDTLTSIENLWGSPFADVLTGDTGPNTLVGWQGSDSLSGKEGADVMAVRDGTADQVTCGPGADQVIADTQGTDSIFSDCEMVDFAPFVPPPPGSDPGTSPPPGTDPGTSPPPPPATDTVAPLLDRLGLKPASFSLKARRVGKRLRRGGTEISYRLSETAAVTFGVQRAAVGRRKGRRCVAVTSKNRGGRACRRWTGVRGALLHAGLPALNRLHFAGRIGGRPLGPGRYRLTAVARDGAGNRSVRRLAGFSVLR